MPPPVNLEGATRLINAGQYEAARMQLMRMLPRFPADGFLNNAIAIVLTKLGQHAQSLFYAERAAATGGNPVFLETLAHALANNRRPAEGAAAYRRAISMAPSEPMFHVGISSMLQDAGDHKGAVEALSEAVRLRPDEPSMRAMYASAMEHVGEVEEAIHICRSMLDRFPNDRSLLQALLLTLNYSDRAEPHQVQELHRRFGALVEHDARPIRQPEPRPTGRKLRVGYLSPDFRQHSVAYFIEPILEHHNRDRVEVFAYFTTSTADSTTARLKQLPLTWRDVPTGTDEEVARKIAGDKLDVLVELSGLTTGNRLGVTAHRPAAVQMTYCGYPNTTGLTSIDYRIVDGTTDPAGAESRMTEKPLRLPGCFLCYRPFDAAPSLDECRREPASRSITFGSFNSCSKLSAECITIWARVLKAIPGSRLVLKCRQFTCPWVRSRFAERFAAAGISPDALDILPPIEDKARHLAAYSRIDIALDPWPYNGTTTTCEALWMGVPVITLEGRVHTGRVGASLLHAAGLDELVARSHDEYERAAVTLASDPARLAGLHRTLRDQVRRSPLCDAPRFVRGLEETFEQVCANESGPP